MVAEIPVESVACSVEQTVRQVLWEAEVAAPPVDACLVANRLGMTIARDERAMQRGRIARQSSMASCVMVRPDDRPERYQWAVAHEIGERVVYRTFSDMGVDPRDVPRHSREQIANTFAGCLLLPGAWLESHGAHCDWDLFSLKHRFSTASHELIARRALEVGPHVVVSLLDHGQIVWRKSSAHFVPPMDVEELKAWRHAHESGEPTEGWLDPIETGMSRTRVWPIHEPGWRREIVRSELANCFEI